MTKRKRAYFSKLHSKFYKELNKPMSIYDQIPEQDSSNSRFLNKMADGENQVLKFKDMLVKDQPENTPDEFKTPDGKVLVFYFEDSAGQEKEIKQNGSKGKFYKAMRTGDFQPGATLSITRHGLGTETEWEIAKVSDDGTVEVPPKEEEKTDSIPF